MPKSVEQALRAALSFLRSTHPSDPGEYAIGQRLYDPGAGGIWTVEAHPGGPQDDYEIRCEKGMGRLNEDAPGRLITAHREYLDRSFERLSDSKQGEGSGDA